MIHAWKAVLVGLAIVVSPLAAQDRERGPRTYTISSTFTQAGFEPNDQGRPVLKNTTTTLPDIVTLEDSKAELLSETRHQEQLYQHIVQVRVQRVSENKVRLEIQVENVWSDGIGATTTHRKSLHSTRLVTLGSNLKLTLQNRDDRKGEGITVDVVVKEAPEE